MRLNCSTVSSTEQSLSAIFGIQVPDLRAQCRGFDLNGYYEHTHDLRELPRLIVGRDAAEIAYVVCFFHATRSLDPSRQFADGLRPLGDVVERVRNDLRSLTIRYCDKTDWERFRRSVDSDHPSHYASLYRLKVQDSFTGGRWDFSYERWR